MTKTFSSLFMIGLAATLIAGCTAPADEDVAEDVDSTEDELSAPTCAASIAAGAVAAKHRAMLDTIAFTEGTANTCGNNGYNTMFSHRCFSSCNAHPNIAITAGGYTSTAAGRYQFLKRTWSTLGYSTFSPKNQDLAAMKLVSRRGVTLPTTRALTATEFSNAMKKISYEWASLPFSPYGQPTVSLSRTRAKYCSFAGC